MLKTYTLNNRVDEQLSPSSGKVIFHVTDELGDERKIAADTFLDENKLPQGVTASNKRELPLVEGLFRMELGETTTIDFDSYNTCYDREQNKTCNQVAYDEVLKMKKEQRFFYKLGQLFKASPKNQSTAA